MSKNMSVSTKDGVNRVDIAAYGDEAAGIWITNDHGTIGLVAQDGMPPYMVIYGKNMEAPALALYAGESDDAYIQVPGPHGMIDVRIMPLSLLFDMLNKSQIRGNVDE